MSTAIGSITSLPGVGAARAYQANLAAIGIIRDMVAKALELGKG